MVNVWFYVEGGKLYFAYRAMNWSATPPVPLNATELTGVAASAFDETGSPITVAQQPSYVAALGAYVGWILAAPLEDKRFVSIRLTPTLGPGIPVNWAPTKRLDVNIDPTFQEILTRMPAVSGDIQIVGTRPVS